jgi:hypothetical protein
VIQASPDKPETNLHLSFGQVVPLRINAILPRSDIEALVWSRGFVASRRFVMSLILTVDNVETAPQAASQCIRGEAVAAKPVEAPFPVLGGSEARFSPTAQLDYFHGYSLTSRGRQVEVRGAPDKNETDWASE